MGEHRTPARAQTQAVPEGLGRPEPARASGAADAILRLQRSVGNRRTAAMVHAAPARQLQRYKILGPWNAGQAVHETLTLLAVGKAIEQLKAAGKDRGELLEGFDTGQLPSLEDRKGHKYDPAKAQKSHQQFIRGVVWADDPMGLLFDEEQGTSNYSSGLLWYHHYKRGEKGKFDPDDLVARSHFGDLQFFHGMASKDDESPKVTKGHMLNWARFLIDVATGRTPADTRLKDVAGVKDLFPANADWTIKRLFGWAKASDKDTRQRAVGALFHMIQDSYAHGHVERDERTGDILEFHAYGHQDEGKHGKYDYFAEGRTLGERIARTVGAATAIDRCADVLTLIAGGESTDTILLYLDDVVLRFADGARLSGPGTGLGKKGEPTPTPKPTPPEPLPQGAGDYPLPEADRTTALS
jgi:hypothetical protein